MARTLDRLLDELIAEVVRRVDLDAAARRLDIEAVLDRVDLTATVLYRVDLRTVVREVLDQLDERSIALVVSRVDVDGVAQRLDLDAVAKRLDVDAVAQRLDVEAVLDRIDLTSTVLRRVDLKAVVDAALAQVDLVALAEQVIDGVDLPEIIRDSTGSMASETVKGVRMQGIEADQAVGRAMDRLLLRHARRSDEPNA
ncbi:hypothetical protein [Nocardioides koreensis]|uniref:hypothetical protein n=1 Tax=Nocardioides koreensis TaxID=433651 RepID=UPI0031CF9EDE